MNYRLKISLQKFISKLPKAEKINFLLQRFITKSLPIPLDEFKEKISTVKTHFKNFQEYGKTNITESVYYEIGAGYDMVIPISMSLLGFKKLICIDVRKLTFPLLLNDAVQKIQIIEDAEIKLSDLQKGVKFTNKNTYEVFKELFSIYYQAPADARNTFFKENSVDYVLTNAVMEHIPTEILGDIMKETFRVMKKGAIMSNVIDYKDHFAYFDSNISFYNYLQFTEEEWSKMNPSIMFQNRLRHKDYLKFIKDAGFEIVKEELAYPDEKLFSVLKNLKLSKYFSDKYTLDELKILGSQLVLRKPW